ncbi:CRISPR-associated protein Cas5 [Streptomyces tsukubensis]|uniref:CRISPR-associated protein Cas5 n=1 Tax=Streptomyces tsukubensis (strain DSM 42081 / NBRC 108919 / NRRL 18488 / 9993) TaxID=1114943 RepID=A0A7G3UFU3_STRT9|nr:CRISPR-associated protein Cas5 [Streptomyces tsukubensis NRRL18488]TAI44709.1 CRISPR-associated protein Cas5 [Streptomyces tsukubensis]
MESTSKPRPGKGSDWSGRSHRPLRLTGQTWRPPGELASYRQPSFFAVGRSLSCPSRQGVRPPTSSLR